MTVYTKLITPSSLRLQIGPCPLQSHVAWPACSLARLRNPISPSDHLLGSRSSISTDHIPRPGPASDESPQVATQPNLDHQRVASLVRNALQDGSFRLQSSSRMEATYQASVNPPVGAHPMSIANLTSTELTIQTRLNDQSQYDIVSANLRDLLGVISINTEDFRPLGHPLL